MPYVYAHQTSAYDGILTCGSTNNVGQGCYSPDLDLWVFPGVNCAGTVALVTSPGNGTWTSRGNPWGATTGFGNGVVWAPALGKFIAVGGGASVGTGRSAVSSNGITWTTGPAIAGIQYLYNVFWSETLGQALATSDGFNVYRSSDGLNWTLVAMPANFSANSFAYHGGLWVGVGDVTSFGGVHAVITSPNGITWTGRSAGAFDTGINAYLEDVTWSPTLGIWVACGFPDPGGPTTLTSPNGTAWTELFTPLRDMDQIIDAGGYIITISFATIHFSLDLKTWETESTPSVAVGSFPLVYSAEQDKLAIFGVGAVSGIFMGTPYPPPRPRTTRFFEGYPWRFIFTDIYAPHATPPTVGSATTTWAQGILTNRQITKTLNQPSTIEGAVWPDDPRANELYADGFPVIAQSNRLVYCFRREGGTVPWVIRAAGILMSPEDQGDADIPLTHFLAYDPWMYVMGRPVLDATGSPPSSAYGFSYTGNTGTNIALQILRNSILADGPCFIDAGVAWGGTPYYGGTLETTDVLVFNVQQGAMVGEVWQQLCDTGTLDIVLTPIYDPVRRPGYTHELSIYRLAGTDQPGVVFGWDKMNRALTTADRAHSGIPGDFVNEIRYYVGQGGIAVGASNGPSVATYGAYWATQFFPIATMPSGQTPQLLAAQALTLGKQGKRTFTISPTPERSPVPLKEYDVGDRVGIYTSRRLRVASSASFASVPAAAQRVQTIPILIDDDGIERIQAAVTSPDYRGPETPVPAPAEGGAVARQSSSAALLASGIRSSRRRTRYRLGRP